MRRWCLPFAFLALSACTSAPRRPLDPAKGEADYRARRLEDAGVGVADPSAEPAPIGFAQLLHAAWTFDPGLEVARRTASAARIDVEGAERLPDPSLSVTPTRITNTSSEPWALAVALDTVWDFARHRKGRIAVAEQEARIAELAVGEAAWQTYRQVRDAYLDRALVEAELDAARRVAELRGEVSAAHTTALELGAVARAEVLRSRAEAADAELEVLRLEGERSVSEAALARAVGVSVAELSRHEISYVLLPDEPIAEASLVDRLDLRRGLAEYERTECRLEQELSQQYPDLHLGPGYEYDQGSHKWSLGIGIDLPIFDRNQSGVHAALAERDRAAAHFLELQEGALGDQEEALASLEAARRRLAALQERALSVQAERERAAQERYELGAADRLEVLSERLETLRLERERLAAVREEQTALSRLEDSRQRPTAELGAWPQEEDDRDG